MEFPAEYGLFPNCSFTATSLLLSRDKIQFTLTTTQRTTVPANKVHGLLNKCRAAPTFYMECDELLKKGVFESLTTAFTTSFWEICESVIFN